MRALSPAYTLHGHQRFSLSMADSDANQVSEGGNTRANDEKSQFATSFEATGFEQSDPSMRAREQQSFQEQPSLLKSCQPRDATVPEAQLETGKPRTDGSMYRDQTDLDHTEDGIFSVDMHQRHDDDGCTKVRGLNLLKEPTKVFSRPKITALESSNSIFSFEKASLQQFDLAGACRRTASQSENEFATGSTSSLAGANTNRSPQNTTELAGEKLMNKSCPSERDTVDGSVPGRARGIEDEVQLVGSPSACFLEPRQKHPIPHMIENMSVRDKIVQSFETGQEAVFLPLELDHVDPIPEASSQCMQLHHDLQSVPFGHELGNVVPDQRNYSPPPPPQSSAPSLPVERGVRTSRQHKKATSRIYKQKSKAKHKGLQEEAKELSSDCSGSDTNDYVQILSYKINQHRQSAFAKFEAKINTLQRELQHMRATKDSMQHEVDAVQQQNNNLSVEVERQKNKILAYESKITRFKTFVDGLGNDVNALKKDATINRRNQDCMSQQSKDQKEEQSALLGQLSACAEKAFELKAEAMKICRESQTELQIAGLRIESLESQLSERLGLLAEERDRRAQLERQLANVGLDEKVLRAIKTHSDRVLDKLFEIHATIEQARNADTVSEKVCEAMAAIQALKSANSNDIASIKATVDTLSDSITSTIHNDIVNHKENSCDYDALESRLIEVVDKLRSDLGKHEELIEQITSHRQSMATLRDQLQVKDTNIRDLSLQITDLRAREAELTERNASLRVEIDYLHGCSKATDNYQRQVDEMKAELVSKSNILEAVKNENSVKTEELRVQMAKTLSLQEELRLSQQHLKEVQTQNSAFDAERSQLESKFREEFEKLQKELSEYSQMTCRKEKMKVDNLVQKLTHEKGTLEKEVKMLREELEALTVDREKMRKQESNSEVEHRQVSDDLQRQLQASKEETAASEKALQHALQHAASIEQQNKILSSQLAVERAEHEESIEENKKIAAQVEDLQRAVKEANSTSAAAESKLDKFCSDSNIALQDLRGQVDEANMKLKESEEGFKQYVMMRDEAAADAAAKFARQLSALQDNLVEEQRRFHEQEAKHNEFLTEFEKYTKNTEESHDRAINEVIYNMRDAKSQRDQALTENADLKAELQRLLTQNSQDAARLQNRDPGQTLTVESTFSPIHAKKPSITPTTSNKENEPPKMKRKGDRLTNAFSENEPIPAPQILRPDSNHSSKSLRDLIAGDSHCSNFTLPSLSPQPLQADHQGCHTSVINNTRADVSLENEEMLDGGLVGLKQLPRVVEETQFDDKLPSFADFNNRIMSSQEKSQTPSSVHSMQFLQGFPDKNRDNTGSAADITLNKQELIDEIPGSQHFVDSGANNGSSDMQQARRVQQGSVIPNNPEADKYTYRKSFPNPNSASKRVHHDADDKQSLRSRHSSRGSIHTPKVCNESKRGGSASSHSSSPDFIYGIGTRKNNTYQAPAGSGGVGTHRVPKTSSISVADPRLRKGDPTSLKRKADGYVIESYENVRSKRTRIPPQGGSTGTSRYALRGSEQLSIKDLPSSSSLYSRKERDASRMRTSGGQASRSIRSSRKLSKSKPLSKRLFD